MSDKISYLEPAERPLTIALSYGEVNALVKHHISMTKRVTKEVGKLLTISSRKTAFPRRSESNAVIDQGRKYVEAHCNRAKGLQSLLTK